MGGLGSERVCVSPRGEDGVCRILHPIRLWMASRREQDLLPSPLLLVTEAACLATSHPLVSSKLGMLVFLRSHSGGRSEIFHHEARVWSLLLGPEVPTC